MAKAIKDQDNLSALLATKVLRSLILSFPESQTLSLQLLLHLFLLSSDPLLLLPEDPLPHAQSKKKWPLLSLQDSAPPHYLMDLTQSLPEVSEDPTDLVLLVLTDSNPDPQLLDLPQDPLALDPDLLHLVLPHLDLSLEDPDPPVLVAIMVLLDVPDPEDNPDLVEDPDLEAVPDLSEDLDLEEDPDLMVDLDLLDLEMEVPEVLLQDLKKLAEAANFQDLMALNLITGPMALLP